MKSKFLISFSIVFTSICLAACMPTSNGSTNDSSAASSESSTSVTVRQLLKKIKKANEKMYSTAIDMNLKIYENSNSPTKNQTMTGDLIYDTDTTDLAKGQIVLNTTENGQKTYEEIVMPGGEDYQLYRRDSKDGTWTEESQNSGNGFYYVQPDYFKLIEPLLDMEDDLKLEETDDEYILSLDSQNVDIIGLFGEQFNLKLTGVSQSEMKKTLKVTFNKKDFYLKNFKLSLNYNGNKGKLKITTDVDYSDWNKVDEDSITAPSQSSF